MDDSGQISLESMDDGAFFTMMKDISFPEFSAKLRESGLDNHHDQGLFIDFMILRGISNIMNPNDPNSHATRELRFSYEYGLSKVELDTLKRFLKGERYYQIAKTRGHQVSADAIRKRLGRVYKKLKVERKEEAALLARKEGLSFWFDQNG